MSYLNIETDGRGCTTFWLNRPSKRNALDESLLSDLLSAAVNVRQSSESRVVVVRSTSAIFCAGADLNDWSDVTPYDAQRLSMLGSKAFQELADLPVPVIMVLEGAALGGGLELALAGDLRIATTNAKLGFPEARLGNTPAWGGVPRLAKLAGNGTVLDLLLTGDAMSAEAAVRVGIVQRLCAPADLERDLEALIDSVLACDSVTHGYIKTMFGEPRALTCAQEAALAGFTATREDSKARKRAFLESRRRS